MRLFSTLVLATFALSIAACGKKSGGSSTITNLSCNQLPAAPAGQAPKYNESKNACYVGNTTAYVTDSVGECGCIAGKDFNGQDLSNKNLRGIVILDSNLNNANLSKADLTGANLRTVSFVGADLSNADLKLVYSTGVDFSNANIKGMNGVHNGPDGIIGSAFKEAKFTGAKFDGKTRTADLIEELIAKGAVHDVNVTEGATVINLAGQNTTLEFSESGKYGLKDYTIKRVKDDMQVLAGLDVDFSAASNFKKLFGGDTMASVIRFFDERVSYFIDDPTATSTGTVIASNKAAYWLLYYVAIQADTVGAIKEFNINGRYVAVKTPRAGVIAIDKGYRELYNPQMARIGTLMHEARHSDCTKEPGADDIRAISQGQVDQIKDRSCLHLHYSCPSGHDLAGAPACDKHVWGSYAVSMKFAEGIYKGCKNCSEVDKQLALVTMKDAEGRLLYNVDQLNNANAVGPSQEFVTTAPVKK